MMGIYYKGFELHRGGKIVRSQQYTNDVAGADSSAAGGVL